MKPCTQWRDRMAELVIASVVGGSFLLVALIPVWGGETRIKGGRMELIDKGKTVVFSDGVHLSRGHDVVIADKMVTDEKRVRIKVTGKVHITRIVPNKEKLHGYGSEGFYNTKTGAGYILGGKKQAHLIYTEISLSTSVRHIDIYSNRIDFLRSGHKSIAKGRVYGKTKDPDTHELYEFWSDVAEFDQAENKLTLSGSSQPRVRQTKEKNEKIITGDVIFYYIDAKKFISDGNAQVVFIEPSQKEN